MLYFHYFSCIFLLFLNCYKSMEIGWGELVFTFLRFSGGLSNLIILLSTMVLKILISMFDKISMSELGCWFDLMEVIFVVATSPSLMSFFHKQFQVLTLKVLCIFESCIEIKIKLNFYFHTLWCHRRFYEGL